MNMNMRKYKVGEKIPLSEIETGDIIRFETADQPVSVGMVNQIAQGNALKSRVFFDPYAHMLNFYPDQVTDAYVVMLRADINRAGTGEENKNYEGIKALKAVDTGTVYKLPTGRAQLGTRLIIKNAEDHWSQIDVYNRGHAELRMVGDRDVVTQLWDKTDGLRVEMKAKDD